MSPLTLKELAAGIVETVREYIDGRFKEFKQPADGVDGKDGKDGKDAEPIQPEVIAAMVLEAASVMPAPKDGEDGKDGASVTPEDVAPMVEAEVSKALAKIEPAKDGKSVPIEDVEKMVADAVSKAMAAVRMPNDGRDGQDGCDALDIDIMPSIDAAKRYRRGVYASHNGGLWVTRKTTEGMDGWQCIVDGVADVEAGIDDDARTVRLRSFMASGAEKSFAFAVPTMIYKDLFKEGRIYAKGDVVTWAGHMWVCKQETDIKPVEGDCWRICVKRGQDGKSHPFTDSTISGLTGKAVQ